MPPKTKYGSRGDFQGVASKHPLYFRWLNMLRRCYEPTFDGYQSYGGRGVTVEPYLQNFANYVEFVSSLTNYEKLLQDPNNWQIDKDEHGGAEYSRETLQIIPSEMNLEIENRNKRVPVYRVNVDGSKTAYFSFTDAEKKTGIHRGNISRAVRNGWMAGGFEWERAND